MTRFNHFNRKYNTKNVSDNYRNICIKCMRMLRSSKNLPYDMHVLFSHAQLSFPGCEREHNGPCSGCDDSSFHKRRTKIS